MGMEIRIAILNMVMADFVGALVSAGAAALADIQDLAGAEALTVDLVAIDGQAALIAMADQEAMEAQDITAIRLSLIF